MINGGPGTRTVQRTALRNRRGGDGRNAADSGCARRQRRSRDQELVALGCSRTTAHAGTRISVAIGVRLRETVRQCLQKRQRSESPPRRSGQGYRWSYRYYSGPLAWASNLPFGRSSRAMSRSNRVRILVARIVEMHDLLEALKIAVVKEPFLEVRPRGLRWWDIASVSTPRRARRTPAGFVRAEAACDIELVLFQINRENLLTAILRNARITSRPIIPAPITATLLPGLISVLLAACTAIDTASINAAFSKGKARGNA
jgi:hypothetical protein